MCRVGRGLLRDHLRDVQQVKGLSCRGVVLLLLLLLLGDHAGVLVLDQCQRPEHHPRHLCSEAVLHLPLQLHPAVLEPGPDLQKRTEPSESGQISRWLPTL